MKKGLILPMVMAALLGGCAATGPSASDIGPAPAGWKEATRNFVRMTFKDPESVKNALISAPVPASMVFDGITPIPHSGWMVCLSANAKNSFGGYTGQQIHGLLFVNGRISVSLPPEYSMQTAQHCSEASFQPFEI